MNIPEAPKNEINSGGVGSSEGDSPVSGNEEPAVDSFKTDEPPPDVTSSDLNTAKLRLEVKALQFKHSISGRLLDYLPVVGQLIALAALVWTVNGGIRQQAQVQEEAVEARYERAYSNLGSASPSERGAAITQLSSMLGKNGRIRDEEMLRVLAMQAALDDSPDIRGSIVNIFDTLPYALDKALVSSTLKFVIQLQRNLRGNGTLNDAQLASLTANDQGKYMTIRKNSLNQLTTEDQDRVDKLASLGNAMLALINSGGRLSDMRGIVCIGCDFSRTRADLSGVDFSGSLLGETTWLNMKLNGANFESADLSGANFDGAEMRHAKLSTDTAIFATVVRGAVLQQEADRRSPVEVAEFLLPHFHCADLSEATIRDLIIGVAVVDPKKRFYDLSTRFPSADFAGVDFNEANLFIVKREETLRDPDKVPGDYWVLEEKPAIFDAYTEQALNWRNTDQSVQLRLAAILQSGRNFNRIELLDLPQMPVARNVWNADCNSIAQANSETYRWSMTLIQK